MSILLAALGLLAHGQVQAATFYVRTDGGSASQCTGKSDAAYSGSGSAQACAWKHPYYALPPNETARMVGGDTLIIGPGEYMIGWGAPGSADQSGRCYSGGRYDCYLPPIPSGTTATKTRILGKGYDGSCAAPPKLWGTERVSMMLNLQGSSNVEVGCLEITDKSDCVESHSDTTARCVRDTVPYGNWASMGIQAKASSNVYLHDLNIHGLANRGIFAGGVSNWTLERVKINANGWAGWDGDIGTGSSNSGQILMRNIEIGWNGCGERWQSATPWACWAQTGSGYGDGLGTATTGGQWVIEDSYVHHNTSDGIDLLYLDGAANTSATLRRVKAEGNAGNQIKTKGTALIENSVVIGNCSYFLNKYNMQLDDQCRALGNTLSLALVAGQTATVRHNTVIGEGDCLIMTSGGSSASKVNIQNNALLGQLDWRSNLQGNAGELTCGHYADNSTATVAFSGNLLWNVKASQCPSGSICAKNPVLANISMSAFDPTPATGSPLINAAPVISEVTTDFFGRARPVGGAPDIGAIEAGATSISTSRVTGGVLPPTVTTTKTTSGQTSSVGTTSGTGTATTATTGSNNTSTATKTWQAPGQRMMRGLVAFLRQQMAIREEQETTGLRAAAYTLPGVSWLRHVLLSSEAAEVAR